MNIIESIGIIICLLCCSGGLAWLLYDIRKVYKMHKELERHRAERESTLGLVEDDEE